MTWSQPGNAVHLGKPGPRCEPELFLSPLVAGPTITCGARGGLCLLPAKVPVLPVHFCRLLWCFWGGGGGRAGARSMVLWVLNPDLMISPSQLLFSTREERALRTCGPGTLCSRTVLLHDVSRGCGCRAGRLTFSTQITWRDA